MKRKERTVRGVVSSLKLARDSRIASLFIIQARRRLEH